VVLEADIALGGTGGVREVKSGLAIPSDLNALPLDPDADVVPLPCGFGHVAGCGHDIVEAACGALGRGATVIGHDLHFVACEGRVLPDGGSQEDAAIAMDGVFEFELEVAVRLLAPEPRPTDLGVGGPVQPVATDEGAVLDAPLAAVHDDPTGEVASIEERDGVGGPCGLAAAATGGEQCQGGEEGPGSIHGGGVYPKSTRMASTGLDFRPAGLIFGLDVRSQGRLPVRLAMKPGRARRGGVGALAVGVPLLALVLFAQAPSEWPPSDWLGLVPARHRLGDVVGLVLMGVGFGFFRRRFWSADVRAGRSLNNGMVLLVAQALILRVTLEFLARMGPGAGGWAGEVWLWTPWFLTTGLAVILLGGPWGVLLSLSGAFFLQLMRDPGSVPVVGTILAGFVAVLLLRRSPTRARVLRAGAGSGAFLALVAGMDWALVGGLREGMPAALVPVLAPIMMGIASAFLVLALLPVVEWIMGELSDVSLTECGSDHPLLDELREQAPGTWHHTLNVADLSRKAAAAVGARALFCYTAALFHDVGKLKEPGVFAENITGVSPHDELDPRESARRIIGHVSHGLELARRHRLPHPFRDIIAEHHGSSIVRFFHAKALEQLPPGEDPEALREAFRYPGPPPATRESGIIALADMVEAATRSRPDLNPDELQTFVRGLIAQRVSEGELGECPLTLADVAEIERVFLSWLSARHHQRPVYPKAEVVEPLDGAPAPPEVRSAPTVAGTNS
jgi:cyclic-di-AMP phosphodiesterase PgpH